MDIQEEFTKVNEKLFREAMNRQMLKMVKNICKVDSPNYTKVITDCVEVEVLK